MATSTTETTNARETFESLELGGEISLPEYYENPMTVTFVGDFMVGVRDSRGNERELIQNKPNPERISLMVGATCKGVVSEIKEEN